MTETAGAVQNGFVLRMSVPASGELGALGPELGAKLAEQLGVDVAGAAKVGEAMAELARGLESAHDISFVFHKDGAALRIQAQQGDVSRKATVPLGV
jgi:hypothetical protein